MQLTSLIKGGGRNLAFVAIVAAVLLEVLGATAEALEWRSDFLVGRAGYELPPASARDRFALTDALPAGERPSNGSSWTNLSWANTYVFMESSGTDAPATSLSTFNAQMPSSDDLPRRKLGYTFDFSTVTSDAIALSFAAQVEFPLGASLIAPMARAEYRYGFGEYAAQPTGSLGDRSVDDAFTSVGPKGGMLTKAVGVRAQTDRGLVGFAEYYSSMFLKYDGYLIRGLRGGVRLSF